MTQHYKLGLVSQIPEGEGRTFDVGGAHVAVFRTRDGGVFATQAQCPHRQGPLADGLLGTHTLVCPLHEWKFDLATGKALQGECNLSVYPIVRDGEELTLELPA
jgi:nitrite reductase (NADH) small subunit